MLLRLSTEEAWSVVIGLFVAGAVLSLLVNVVLLFLLWKLMRYGWKHLRSTNQLERLEATVTLILVGGIVLYNTTYFVRERWEERQRRGLEQEKYARMMREAALAQRVADEQQAQREARYFQRLAAGQVDSATARQVAQAEKQWAARLATRDSMGRTSPPPAAW